MSLNGTHLVVRTARLSAASTLAAAGAAFARYAPRGGEGSARGATTRAQRAATIWPMSRSAA